MRRVFVRGEPVTMRILSEYRELGEIERAISRSPNSGLTECTYGCGLNLEHCSKSQQLDTGYVCIYRKVESASGLPPFVGANPAVSDNSFLMGLAQSPKVICSYQGGSKFKLPDDGNQELLTVIECISGDGRVIPSLIIYKGANHYMGWHRFTGIQKVSVFIC